VILRPFRPKLGGGVFFSVSDVFQKGCLAVAFLLSTLVDCSSCNSRQQPQEQQQQQQQQQQPPAAIFPFITVSRTWEHVRKAFLGCNLKPLVRQHWSTDRLLVSCLEAT
jgi:hypothetical protein